MQRNSLIRWHFSQSHTYLALIAMINIFRLLLNKISELWEYVFVFAPLTILQFKIKCFDKTTNQTLHQSAAEHGLPLVNFLTGWLDWREEESIGSNQAKLKCSRCLSHPRSWHQVGGAHHVLGCGKHSDLPKCCITCLAQRVMQILPPSECFSDKAPTCCHVTDQSRQDN